MPLNHKFKYKNFDEQILLDFQLNNEKNIYCYDCIQCIKFLRSFDFKIFKTNVYDLYIKRYWPNLQDNTNLVKYASRITDTINKDLKKFKIDKMHNNILNEEKIYRFLETINTNIDGEEFKCKITQSMVGINDELKNKKKFINLNNLFYILEPINDIVQISYTNQVIQDKKHIFKINKNYFFNNIHNKKYRESLRQKLFEELKAGKKDEKISIKIANNIIEGTFFHIILHPQGNYKILMPLEDKLDSTFDKVTKTMHKNVANMIKNINQYNIFYKKKLSITPPYDTNYETNINFINFDITILFNSDKQINMEIYTKILDKFKTHVIIEDDLTIIREHFKYLKNIDLIIKNLKQNQIFYIYQIKKYTTQNLEKLYLLGKLEDSAKFCYDLKNFANKFQRNKTIFIYKKFSEFKNKKRVYKYIQDMLTSKK